MENMKVSTATMPTSKDSEQFVDPLVFIAEMTSRRHLVRCDTSGATIRGLLDPTTGRRILVEEDRLLKSQRDN